MLVLPFIVLSIFSYALGVYIGSRFEHVGKKNKKDVSKEPKAVLFFDDSTFFVDSKDVVESYKQSTSVVDFINKIK